METQKNEIPKCTRNGSVQHNRGHTLFKGMGCISTQNRGGKQVKTYTDLHTQIKITNYILINLLKPVK